MIRYLFVVVFAGMAAFIWTQFASRHDADTVTAWFLALVGIGFVFIVLLEWRKRVRDYPQPEPPEPAEQWVQKVHRIPGTGRHWEPGQDEG